MNSLKTYIAEYLEYCNFRKRLDIKTLKAYKIDLNQYATYATSSENYLSKASIDYYITNIIKQVFID